MINAKGEVIYTNAEIAYELGLTPATVSVEEDAKRLAALHDVVQGIMRDYKLDDEDTRKRVDNDIHLKKED